MLEGGIRYRIGPWPSDNEDNSSNYPEFQNVVDALREEDKAGNLVDALISICMTTQLLSQPPSKEFPQAKNCLKSLWRCA